MGSVTNFSVANSIKRGMVVLFGAIAMGTPMSFASSFGASLAVLGTAAYWVSWLSDCSVIDVNGIASSMF